MLELHCHSTCSDGVLSPSDLVHLAHKNGVKALALTDHDTLAGVAEAQQTALALGIEIIPALELSTTHQGYSLHLLGFYPDPSLIALALEERRLGRVRRTQRIIEKLAALKIVITQPDVPAPGRPHIARALLAAGYVSSEREAFDRYLGEDKPAYEPYERLGAADGVRLLRSCRAVPVWAHPLLFRGGPTQTVLEELVHAGLQGIEVYRPETRAPEQQRLLQWANQHQLVITGGSDYHGQITKERDPIKLNMLKLPLTLLKPLQELALKNLGSALENATA